MSSETIDNGEMNKQIELEVKVLDVDVQQVAEKLVALGAEKILDTLTLIEGFDFLPDQVVAIDPLQAPEKFRPALRTVQEISSGANTLFSQGAYLRLRQEEDRFELILKAPTPKQQSSVKIEIEISVGFNQNEWEQTSAMLRSLGLQRVVYQQKKRVSFLYPKLELRFDLDTWPKMPPYLEIEGPNERAIFQGVVLLGFEREQAMPLTGREVFELYGVDPSYLVFKEQA